MISVSYTHLDVYKRQISIFVTGARTNTLPSRSYTQLKSGVTPEINALGTIMLIVTFFIVVLSRVIGNKMSR